MVLFLFLHCLFPHNAWILESSYYSENYADIIASSLLLRERATYSESEEESAAPGSYSGPVSVFAGERVGDPLSTFAGDSVGEDGCCALVGE